MYTIYTPNEEGGYNHVKVRLSISGQVDSLTAGLPVHVYIHVVSQASHQIWNWSGGVEFSIIQDTIVCTLYSSDIKEAVARLYKGILATECI
jgi:hypothetical protein